MIPEWLSRNAEKSWTFEADVYFREHWDELSSTPLIVERRLNDIGTIAFKPDLIASGRAESCVRFLEARGLRIISSVAFDHHRHLTRRGLGSRPFGWQKLERIAISDAISQSSPWVLVVVEDPNRSPDDLPTSVRLTALKGGVLGHGAPDSLRAHLRVDNELLNMVHTADEPADVIREASIFVHRRERKALWGHALEGRDRAADLLELVARLAPREPHDLDLAASRRRLQSFGPDDRDRTVLDAYLEGHATWWDLEDQVAASHGSVSWDLLTVGAHLTSARHVHDSKAGTSATWWAPSVAESAEPSLKTLGS